MQKKPQCMIDSIIYASPVISSLTAVGGNIHAALDGKLQKVQESMEDEMKRIAMADVVDDLVKEVHRRG